MNNYKNIAAGLLGFALIAGCNSESVEPNTTEEPTPEVQAATLPAGANTENCATGPAAPELCDWVGSVDAIVWGEIVELRMKEFPAALVTDFSQTAMDCEGPVDAALEMVIDVTDVYHGSPPAQLVVKVGHHQLDEWEPRPALSPDGELVWLGGGAALETGHMVGLAAHQSASGTEWGLMGEVLFTESSGTLVAQDRASCQEPAPLGLVGLTRQQLGDTILACPTQASPAAQTRLQGLDSMWDEKSWAYAGLCHQGGVQYPD